MAAKNVFGPPPRAPAPAPPPRPQRAPEPRSIVSRLRAGPVTFALTAINVIVFLIAESHGSTTTASVLLRFGAVESQHVWAGEYWRLATYMFLHIGWTHLLWNSYASIGWCLSVERQLGHARFLAVYLLSGLAGGAASTLVDYSVSAGASGAMFGIIGATLTIRRRELPSFAAAWGDGPTRTTLISIAIWTAIGMTALPMNNRAHLGGLIGGALATWAFTSRRPAPLWAAYGAAFAALLVFATRPWLHGQRPLPVTGADDPDTEAASNALGAQCEQGVIAACYAFAITMPSYVGDTTRDLEPKCTEGDQDACAAWGWTLAHGRPGVPRDEARGTALMKDACGRDSAWACALAKGASPLAPVPAPP